MWQGRAIDAGGENAHSDHFGAGDGTAGAEVFAVDTYSALTHEGNGIVCSIRLRYIDKSSFCGADAEEKRECEGEDFLIHGERISEGEYSIALQSLGNMQQ